MNLTHDSLLSRHFLWLKLASALYVVAIPISHFTLPHDWIWHIAAFFLFAMLLTYPWAAMMQRQAVGLEFLVSLGLALLGVIGLFVSPWLIIAGIFGHGIWDLAKHRGHGCRFFGWYVSGCVVIDWTYAMALVFYGASSGA